MTSAYKPSGYNDASPYLMVADANELAEFLVVVFGAERLRTIPTVDGRLMHAEARVGDTVIMFADAPEPSMATPDSHIHVYVPDVDATYQRAVDAGAQAVQPPKRKEDADRRGGFKGPGGVTWWVATQQD